MKHLGVLGGIVASSPPPAFMALLYDHVVFGHLHGALLPKFPLV